MSAKVAIVTDSSAHIPVELTRDFPIFTIPLHLNWGERTYRDDVDISPLEFYTRLKVERETPKTSLATPEEFSHFYSRLGEQGYDILSIHVTGRYTRVIDSASQAVTMLPDYTIEVMDSESSAMGLGFPVLEAARAARNGATLAMCRRIAEEACRRTRVFFIPGTLEYLRRGGRVGHLTALLGSILQFKPILTVRNGYLEAISKVRTMHHAIDRLVDIVTEQIGQHASIRLAYLHSNSPAQAQELLEKMQSRLGIEKIRESILTDISPALGTHIGPDAVGLAYILD